MSDPIDLWTGSVVIDVPVPSVEVLVVKGQDGLGVNLSGAVPTYADLPTGLTVADGGKAYIAQDSGLLYTWSGYSWPAEADGAPFKGDKGDQGVGVNNIAVNGDGLDFTMTNATVKHVTVPAITDANNAAIAASNSADASAISAASSSSSATNAATSATNASNSATSASTSATNAAGSATNAAGSATNASTSATNASNSATAADGSKTAAAGSASAAAGSATSAGTSATNANTSATNASNSASAASTSATNAGNSASSASSSATNADNSKTAAAASAAAAQQSAEDAASVVNDGVPNASATIKGGIKLPGSADGELGGTWDHPTVTGWSKKADLVGGKIPTSQIPAQATHEFVVVTNTAARLALTSDDVQIGDSCLQINDPGRGTYSLQSADPSQPGSWILNPSPTDVVTSVNSMTGPVILGKADIGLSNVDNTSDANKPVSTATTTALNAKVATSRQVISGTGLSGGGDLTTDRTLTINYGTSAGTACQGNDSRLTDTRTPTDGSVTAAKIAAGAVTSAKLGITSNYQLIGTDGTGTLAGYPVDTAANAGTVPQRLTGGTVAVGTPTNDAHAATKLYVDSNIATQVSNGIASAQLLVTNAQTGTTYTLVYSDANKVIELNNAAAITLTIASDANTTGGAIPNGSVIQLLQTGAGAVTISAGSGATVNGKTGITSQWGSVVLQKRTANTWVVL